MVDGAHAMNIVPDKTVDELNVDDFDAVIIPEENPGGTRYKK